MAPCGVQPAQAGVSLSAPLGTGGLRPRYWSCERDSTTLRSYSVFRTSYLVYLAGLGYEVRARGTSLPKRVDTGPPMRDTPIDNSTFCFGGPCPRVVVNRPHPRPRHERAPVSLRRYDSPYPVGAVERQRDGLRTAVRPGSRHGAAEPSLENEDPQTLPPPWERSERTGARYRPPGLDGGDWFPPTKRRPAVGSTK